MGDVRFQKSLQISSMWRRVRVLLADIANGVAFREVAGFAALLKKRLFSVHVQKLIEHEHHVTDKSARK